MSKKQKKPKKSSPFLLEKKWTLEKLNKLPKSPQEGHQKGSTVYFDGKLCPRKHLSPKVLTGHCAQCNYERARSTKAREYNKRHNAKPERKKYLRERHLMEEYEITSLQFDVARILQKFRCGLCGERFKLFGDDRDEIVVDHDHETGKVRSLLHMAPCNLLVGHYESNPERYMSVPEYVKRHRKT